MTVTLLLSRVVVLVLLVAHTAHSSSSSVARTSASPTQPLRLSRTERDEVRLFSFLCHSSTTLIDAALSLLHQGVRSVAHTIAGLLSTPLKGSGGFLRFFFSTVQTRSRRLARPKAPDERMPHAVDRLARAIGRLSSRVSSLGLAVGEAGLVLGEAVEQLATHFDAATSDSFRLLHMGTHALEKGSRAIFDLDNASVHAHNYSSAIGNKHVEVSVGGELKPDPSQSKVKPDGLIERDTSLTEVRWSGDGFRRRPHWRPPFLLIALTLVAAVTIYSRGSTWQWAAVPAVVLGCWVLVAELNRSYVSRLVDKTQADAVVAYISSLAQTAASSSALESCVWLNVLLAGLWRVEHGGLGLYVSESLKLVLDEQLGLVPPGLARISLRRFSLGSRPPTVKGVRMFRGEAPVCLAYTQRGCHRLILQLDLAYVSREMDISLVVRPTDAQSLLPEVTVSLSELAVAGLLQIDAELIPDYPFFGNASLAFLERPVTDLSIYSLGGVELSSLPGIDQWLNGSIDWLLGQFTAPRSARIDLRLALCPLCNVEMPEVSTWTTLTESMRTGASTAMSLLQRGREVVLRRLKSRPIF